MVRRSALLTTIVALLTVIAIVGAFNSFQRKRDSFERLDFRYQWKNGVIVVEEVQRQSGAARAGLEPGDEIWVIGGVPTADVKGIKSTLRRAPEVPLLIARGEETLAVRYSAPKVQIEYPYLFLTFTGFLYLAIGLFTLARGARGESLLFFFMTLLTFIVYAYSPAGRVDGTYKALFLVEELARILLPPVTLHFFLRFPRPAISSRWMIGAIYALPLLLILWNANLLLLGNAIPIASAETSFRVIERWEMFHFAIYFTLAIAALAYTYRTAPAAGQRKQIKWIFLGMAAGFVPFLLLYLVPFVVSGAGTGYTSVAILPLAFIPVAFAVSILRYKLWDVEVVIKEVLAYTVTLMFGIIAFSTVNLMLSRLIEEHLSLERNFLAFTSGLLIAGVLVPVKGRLESVIEMFVYRDTYRHRKAILDFAHELATFHDLRELIDSVRERLAAAINLHQMNLYAREGRWFVIYTREPGLPARISEEDVRAFGADRPLVLDAPHLPIATEVPGELLRQGYRYLFPLRHRGELQGLLIVGNKGEHEPLSRDDMHLVGSLTAPVALAIENARLYGRLRRQLDEIRSLKEYNENIIESSSSAIAVVAADGTILTGNQAFWSLMGVGPESEENIEQLFPPIRHFPLPHTNAVETRFVNRTGEEKSLTVSISPFNATDAPEGTVVLVIGDISERVRLERELQDKDRLAALGMLAAGVAHEVNTPLTGISSYAQLLLADTPPEDPKYEILRKMEQQTFRASHLVNNLLNFARSEHASGEVVDLAELVRNTLSLNENLLQQKAITVDTGQLPRAEVRGDLYQLQQVLTNLLLNARDAVAYGGRIWLCLKVEGGRAVLQVGDNGRGIPPDLLDRIFEPLVTTKRAQGGTGLGLAISQRIVHAHAGEITAANAPGGGATFTVSLPLHHRSVSDN
jgi:two-component system, NtrC family, sensor kinase